MMPRGVEVFIGAEPIDLRWSFDRLAGVVTGRLGRDVRGRAVFVFFGKSKSAMKALYFDGTGLCLFYKRLDRGTFRLPDGLNDGGSSVQVTEYELDELMSGMTLEASSETATQRGRVH
jgi:transposase